jgi:hypothetical protein
MIHLQKLVNFQHFIPGGRPFHFAFGERKSPGEWAICKQGCASGKSLSPGIELHGLDASILCDADTSFVKVH